MSKDWFEPYRSLLIRLDQKKITRIRFMLEWELLLKQGGGKQ